MKQKPMWMDAALLANILLRYPKKEPCRSTFNCSFARKLSAAEYQPSPRRFGRYLITKLNVGSVFSTPKAFNKWKTWNYSFIWKCLNSTIGMEIPVLGSKESGDLASSGKFTTQVLWLILYNLVLENGNLPN